MTRDNRLSVAIAAGCAAIGLVWLLTPSQRMETGVSRPVDIRQLTEPQCYISGEMLANGRVNLREMDCVHRDGHVVSTTVDQRS